MALKKSRNTAVAHSKNKFAETIHTIARSFSLFTVFDDFLTMSIAACTQNLVTKKSWYEDEYLETIGKYKDSELRHEFPKAFAYLVSEMEEMDSSLRPIPFASLWPQLHILTKSVLASLKSPSESLILHVAQEEC